MTRPSIGIREVNQTKLDRIHRHCEKLATKQSHGKLRMNQRITPRGMWYTWNWS